MTDVAAGVMEIVAMKAKLAPAEIQLTDRLEDLKIDSLSAVELIFDIEEKFDIQVPYNANESAAEFSTVADIVRAVEKLVGPA